jgi:hypothetical protein
MAIIVAFMSCTLPLYLTFHLFDLHLHLARRSRSGVRFNYANGFSLPSGKNDGQEAECGQKKPNFRLLADQSTDQGRGAIRTSPSGEDVQWIGCCISSAVGFSLKKFTELLK